MKLVIQRVKKASVKVKKDDEVVGRIGVGLFILVGFGMEDTKEDVEKMVKKVLNLRVMVDSEGKMNLSIMDTSKEILVVSQFTLYADTEKGNRPSFIKAAEPGLARDLYRLFVMGLTQEGVKVETGKLGEYMEVDVQLDGPVTIEI